ncbi:hypothetical protein ACF0H5_020005 [Mactra antiquata]
MLSKMDDTGERKDKVTSTRRNNKPLMEKRRRQRINDCLVQLKGLVLQAMNKDSTQYSKLEKADILEMTVKHLKMVQRQQMTVAMATDPNVISKYRAGFNECASEIARYLDTVNGGNPELRARVMNYLANSMMQFPVIPVYQGVVSPYPVQMTSPTTSQHGFSIPQFSHSSSSIYSSQHHHHQQQQSSHQHHQQSNHHQSIKHQRDFIPRPQTNTETVIKAEPPLTSGSHDSTSRVPPFSHSPPRRLPSPCDSDSGLSDSSASFSHDENGNYPLFNINHNVRHDAELRLDSQNSESRRHERTDGPSRQSLKRTCDSFNGNNVSPKRVRVSETVKVDQIAAPVENDSMWRPW